MNLLSFFPRLLPILYIFMKIRIIKYDKAVQTDEIYGPEYIKILI